MARGCIHAPSVCTNWITFLSPGARCTGSQTPGRAQGSLLTVIIELSAARCASRRASSASQIHGHGFLALTILHCTRRVSSRPLLGLWWTICYRLCHHHPYRHRHPPPRPRSRFPRHTQPWLMPSDRLPSRSCPNVPALRLAGLPPRPTGCACSSEHAIQPLMHGINSQTAALQKGCSEPARCYKQPFAMPSLRGLARSVSVSTREL